MLEQLSYGQLNPQNIMGQLGSPQVGGVGSFGIYPQTAGFGGLGGFNPSIGQFGTPVIDPVTAAYIQQQLAHQALVSAGVYPNVSPWGQMGQIGQQQLTPFGVSPLSQILGQQHPYSQIFGQSSPWGQTPYGIFAGQVSPYSQIFGQSSPWGLGQVSPYTQTSPYIQSLLHAQQAQNPLVSQLQAALAAQYLTPHLTQQQFGRVPFGVSPFSQQLGQAGVTGWPTLGRGVSPFTQGVSPFSQGVSPFSLGVSPFTQGVSPFSQSIGNSPFQSFGYGATQ